jgi:hypothetical protein
MHDIVKRDILAVLSKLKDILRFKDENDAVQIKELSNHTIHNASIFQDEHSVSIAVLIYSLSKVMERQSHINYSSLNSIIDSCIGSVRNDDHISFDKSIKEIFRLIRDLDHKFNAYVEEVINQGQVKKGCKLCEHGISVARSSELLGISQWELMNYMGKTTLTDQYQFSSNVKARLKFARSLFQ